MARKKQTPVYPKVELTLDAYAHLPAGVISQLSGAEAVYMLSGPNPAGLVLVSTSSDGKSRLVTMVNATGVKETVK